MSLITSHGWKLPERAIFTPVQTIMMEASPVQRSCPVVSKIGPLLPIMEFNTPVRKP